LRHSLALKNDGSLWAWGSNDSGQLGLGDSVDRDRPMRVGNEGDWADVSAGSGHGLAVKRDGSLWAWGTSGWGELGLGWDVMECLEPTRIFGGGGWAAVYAGSSNSFGLKRDGSLWAWGGNSYYGLLGTGESGHPGRPLRVGADNDWAAVSPGSERTEALKLDGSLWASGENVLWAWQSGEVSEAAHTSIERRRRPARVDPGSDWASLSTGDWRTLAVKRDGSLWVWGFDIRDRLGCAEYTGRPMRVGLDSDWAEVSSGSGGHALALKRDGSLWAWGENLCGELGLGDTENREQPTRVPRFFTPALRGGAIDARAVASTAGDENEGAPAGLDSTSLPHQNLSRDRTGGPVKGDGALVDEPAVRGTVVVLPDFAAVAHCGGMPLAIGEDGTLWAWGDGRDGLAVGDEEDWVVPSRVGHAHDWAAIASGSGRAVLKDDRSLWVVGPADMEESVSREQAWPTLPKAEHGWSMATTG
jgi:alpha-tubulin suppressor-like RCC1 family protein